MSTLQLVADTRKVPADRLRYLMAKSGEDHRSLGRRYALEFAVQEATASRAILRLANQTWLSIDVADRLCILLGWNFSEVYRDRDIKSHGEVVEAARAALRPHGSLAAVSRHRRRREELCPVCQEAVRAFDRQRYRRRQSARQPATEGTV